MPRTTSPIWTPSEALRRQSRLAAYMEWLEENHGLRFDSYSDLWEWSVDDVAAFWESIWAYFGIISHTPYSAVMSGDPMPNTKWFEGSRLNYAEHIFRNRRSSHLAILFKSERHALTAISWQELGDQVARMRTFLVQAGVKKGDCVVGYLPNIPQATIAFLAACSLGAIWSSCSPDFGAGSVIDRFKQIEPKVLVAVDGYQYGAKPFDKLDVVAELRRQMPSIETLVLVPYLDEEARLTDTVLWQDALAVEPESLAFEPVPFDHPIWVLYSSGTTGIPKAITHGHGGMLLEHYKYLALHNDVHAGERFFWFSTTGWMMWNFVQAALLVDATIVLYDGSAGYPDLNALWELAEEASIHHFGTSAPFIVACRKQGLIPKEQTDLSTLRSIGSTGAPLPPEGFDWVYESVKEDVWLSSMSGGTDVCTAFVGGCALEPVYRGEIQVRALGCRVEAWDEAGEPLIGEVGEMVIAKPMPSMPIYFWNDPGKQRYRDSYFSMYPGIWRHGDWLTIAEDGAMVISGRSDATLNRQGIRIGTAEIYRALDTLPVIEDSLIVNLELSGGRHYMPLFVKLRAGESLDEALITSIKQTLRTTYSPRHVPDEIIEVDDIPYTISGKKLEAPVKKILLGMPIHQAANPESMRNPQALDFFMQFKTNLNRD